jgi:hypothetical protein
MKVGNRTDPTDPTDPSDPSDKQSLWLFKNNRPGHMRASPGE